MAKRTKRQQAIRKRNIFLCCVAAAAVVIISAIVLGIKFVSNVAFSPASTSNSSSVSSETEPYIVSTAKVVSTGDILVHSPVLAGAKRGDGSYDFSDFFKAAKAYFDDSSLSVINLEVTLGGSESGAYLGYPAFNTPDSLLDSIKDAGLDLLLTANNHCYDTGLAGLKRTVQKIKEYNLDFVGTRETEEDQRFVVKDVEGVKIGMACYTYENTCQTPGRKSLNGNIISEQANNLVNSFSYERIEEFYADAQKTIEEMKKQKADTIVFYMHWGEEYQLKQNTWQETIAQKLCNLGVDIIIGGHPHVVQPMALLTSEDSSHVTYCLYSMGNSVSNQRQEIMHPECTTGHTEDGVLFYYYIDKYSDGSVAISNVDIIPTWCNKYSGGSGYIYTMYPLENENAGAEKYGLSGSAASKSAASYERTKQIVAPGLNECQTHLGVTPRFQ